MIKLEWKFNGRTVPADRVGDELGKAIRSTAVDAAKAAIRRVKCPVHGVSPNNIRVTGGGSQLRFEYEFCCEGLQQAVNQRLK